MQVVTNIRTEYTKLEDLNQKLNEKLFMLENRGSQKDQKI